MEAAPPRKRLISSIDRYLIGEVLSPFFGSLTFLVFVFLMFQVLRLAEMLIVHGIKGEHIMKMILLLTLSFLPMALPISFLLAVLLGFGRLSTDSELVAMKACGVSVGRMAAPVMALAAFVFAASLALNLEWVPWGENMFKSTVTRMSNTQAVGAVKAGTFNQEFFDLLIFADKVDPVTNEMENVFIFDEREPKTPLTVVARRGTILPVETGTEFGAAVALHLTDGNIHQNNLEEESHQKVNFKKYSLFLEIEEGKDNSAMKPKRLGVSALMSRIASSKPGSATERNYRTELWRRIGIALSPLILAFVGVGFGTFRTRSARASAVFVTFFVILVFWTLLAVATEWGNAGRFHPMIATLLPNFAAGALAWFAYRRASW